MSGGATKQGTKLVVVAVSGTLAALGESIRNEIGDRHDYPCRLSVDSMTWFLGMGTIYLPFFADKDKVRGLHEEGELNASERAEYERVLRELGAPSASKNRLQQPQRPERQSNSMWSRMNQAAGQQK